VHHSYRQPSEVREGYSIKVGKIFHAFSKDILKKSTCKSERGMPRSSGGGGEGALAELTNRDIMGMGTVLPGKAGGAAVFEGMVFAFAGRFSAAQTALKSLVEGGGGSCAASVTLKVTHVITTKAAVEAEKRSTAIATAVGRGLPLLHEDFLARCVEQVWVCVEMLASDSSVQ
jgi:NAD-dependent DNA ligase